MQRIFDNKLWLLVAPLAMFLAACGGGSKNNGGGGGDDVTPNATGPSVISTTPANNGTVPLAGNITATFNDAMDGSTINTTTFTLVKGTDPSGEIVPGEVTYANKVATFNPSTDFLVNTKLTATMTTGAKDPAGNALAANKTWTFTAAVGGAQVPVTLGTAGNFVILAKDQIAVSSAVVGGVSGDIGVSPGVTPKENRINGFLEEMDSSKTFSTSSFVTGKIYSAEYAIPTPTTLATAVTDMEAAYTAAAGLATPNAIDLNGGELGGQTLAPGLYKWTPAVNTALRSGVSISTDVTLSGGPTDVWIFQIDGDLTQAANTKVTLTGGALAKNVFWQVAGDSLGDSDVYIGDNAHFEGIVLARTQISLGAKAVVNGRLLSQTVVTLDQSTVTQPAP